jgi:hypothetical protein
MNVCFVETSRDAWLENSAAGDMNCLPFYYKMVGEI